MSINRFVKSFFRRIRDGEFINAIYLTYYYVYLILYDFVSRTNFAHSHTPKEGGVPDGGTGNFPAHPRLIMQFIKNSNIRKQTNIIDVGSGSGMVLYVLNKHGFINISGIEYSKIAFDISKKNLKNNANLINGDAIDLNLSNYQAITFFSPFRGILAINFFNKIPNEIKTVITVNHDRSIEPILIEKGFNLSYAYEHSIYRNFNGKVWER